MTDIKSNGPTTRQLHLHVGVQADPSKDSPKDSLPVDEPLAIRDNQLEKDAQRNQGTPTVSSKITPKKQFKNHLKKQPKAPLSTELDYLDRILSSYGVPNQELSKVADIIKLLSLLAFFYLSYSGLLTQAMSYLIHADIHQYNAHYLKTATHKAIETLEVMGGIKSVLALMQSFSGGISFIVDINVQLGQSLSAIIDIMDKAWLVSIGSVVAIEGLRVMHYAASFSMQPILIFLFLLLGCAMGLKRITPKFAKKLDKLAILGVFLVFFTHVVSPLSIYLTANISQHFLKPHKEALHQNFKTLHESMPKHSKDPSFKDKIKEMKGHLKKSDEDHSSKTGDYSHLAAKHFIYSIVEFLVLPLSLVALLSYLVIIVIRKEKLLE